MGEAGRALNLPHDVLVASLAVAGLAEVVIIAALAAEARAPDRLLVAAGVAEVPVVHVQTLVLALGQTHPLSRLQALR